MRRTDVALGNRLGRRPTASELAGAAGIDIEDLLDVLERKLKDLDTAVIIATHGAFVAGRMKSQWQMEHGVLRAAR